MKKEHIEHTTINIYKIATKLIRTKFDNITVTNKE